MREVSSQPWKRKEEGGREREKEDRVSDEEGEEGEESKEEKQASCYIVVNIQQRIRRKDIMLQMNIIFHL